MHIECVTVCIGFGDYLAETIGRNRSHIDRMIVVTEENDKITRRLAKLNKCRIVLTDKHREDGDFNKGKVINEGLRAAHRKHWLMYMDADIALPLNFRDNLDRFIGTEMVRFTNNPYESAKKPKTNHFNVIYGASRVNCPGIGAWYDYLETGHHEWPMEKIRSDNSHAPPGYLQLWHSLANVWYPEQYPTAGASDLEFARQFPYRVYMPFTVLHLGQHGKSATDHSGRVSKPWSQSWEQSQ